MADLVDPAPANATPADEHGVEDAEQGPQPLSEDEVAALEARIREHGRRSAPPQANEEAEMALYFSNASGVTAYVTLIWSHGTPDAAPSRASARGVGGRSTMARQ